MSDAHAGHAHGSRTTANRALWIALVANGLYLIVEVVGGLVFNSLALLADAAHMSTDVAGLVIALIAQALIARPASARRTFGLARAEALGALANAALILAAVIWIVIEAIDRLGDPPEVRGAGLLAVAAVGLVVNVVSAVMLRRASGRNLNVRAAFIHMAADAGGSVGALVAGFAVLAFGADWADPAASLLIAVLVVYSTWGLLRTAANVLLEGVPVGMDVEAIEKALREAPDVDAVHHLHVWEVGSELIALSAHVVLRDVETLHDAQTHGDDLKRMLADRFDIDHATLELECHACDDPEHDEHLAEVDR